ncbi:hypothetical protein [Nocardioides sp. TF02-7]|uniref:hypothetical protein n=1 Tax=Nocardioides sp. TF02-7 TaxID=2917724 RepID=UPI001F0507D0|nr:hypothetical protein [Nocardioides sp. TF02-7]UMG95002.1 hypothetical protein MF408_04735 [Nocardioides sp. TF02-7]
MVDTAVPSGAVRLTQYAAGGGCACKVPPGELERVLADLPFGPAGDDLLVGLEHGDDAAAVRIDADRAVVATTDFFTPVVDDPLRLGPDRRDQRALRRLRDGRGAAGRAQPAGLAARPGAVRARPRGAPRRRGGVRGRRLPPVGRPQHRRPGAEVRSRGHRARPPRPAPCATTRPRRARRSRSRSRWASASSTTGTRRRGSGSRRRSR